MAAVQGLCRFNGVPADVRASFTLSHGITPSSCSFEVSPQTFRRMSKRKIGTLEFVFGSTKFAFPQCLVKNLVAQTQGDGDSIVLQIVDRRWRWQFGAISGRYNIRDANQKVIEKHEKTPQELARDLLDRMGESKADVSKLPNDQRPEVDWVGEVPAQALAALCDQLGCRVVLTTRNRVAIEVTGQGRPLPTDRAMTVSYGMDLTTAPDSLIVLGGPTRFQSKLELEAVGVEVDGEIKLIDDLSYKPTDGWEKDWPTSFAGVSDDDDRALAIKTVYRWYRIKQQSDGTQNVPGYEGPPVESITEILPVSRDLIATYEDAEGIQRAKPAVVSGVYWPGGGDLENTDDGTEYPGSWDLDPTGGILRFADPVYKYEEQTDKSFLRKPAELVLLCSYSVTDQDTNQKSRHTRERRLGGRNGTGPRVLRHDDLVGTVIADYGNPSFPNDPDGTTPNINDWNKEADHYLDAVQAEYDTDETGDVQYDDLRRIDPDGAIQQVTWNTGPNGATTRASRNSEYNLAIPSYDERRRQEQLIAAVQKQQGAKP